MELTEKTAKIDNGKLLIDNKEYEIESMPVEASKIIYCIQVNNIESIIFLGYKTYPYLPEFIGKIKDNKITISKLGKEGNVVHY